MAESLDQIVRELAGHRCEYCLMPEGNRRISFVLDHVIARQHGGLTVLANLALCCPRSNQSKGPNIAGIDPESGRLTRLFHPREDLWRTHFRYQTTTLIGLTDVGRATITVLAINLPLRIEARLSMYEAGLF